MRLAGGILALALGAVVVSASAVPGMLTLVPVVHVPGFAPMDPLHLAMESVRGESWVERVLLFARLMDPDLAPVTFEETRGISELVGLVYAHVGLPYDAPDRGMVEAQVAALPAAVGWGLQQFLGAIEVGMMDWRLATHLLTEEDWAELAAVEDDEASPAALDKLDVHRIRVSAVRLVGVVDAVVPVLREAALDAGPSSGEFLFRDPFDLILVGGTGTNAYHGNSAPPGLFLRSTHILVLDLGGEDFYYSELGMAFARDWGIPVSVAVDLGGNDRYTPMFTASMGVAVQGGVSLLVDAGGDDFYWNGGFVIAASSAVSLFLESSGDDSYRSAWNTQSYAIHRGLTLLFDRFGNDAYVVRSGSQAYGVLDGLAALVDGAGSDSFLAEVTNGGFSSPGSKVQGIGDGGLGVFLNIGAQDVYSAGINSQGWTQPGSYGGIFLDSCGNDTYLANSVGRDGATWEQNRFGLGFDVNLPTMPCFVAE